MKISYFWSKQYDHLSQIQEIEEDILGIEVIATIKKKKKEETETHFKDAG